MDILEVVHKTLIKNDYVNDHATGRIKFYEYPPTANDIEPHIIIDPLDTPSKKDYADNKWLTLDSLIQIDVWSMDRQVTLHLADVIGLSMWEDLGFYEISGPNEYDEGTGVFRIANRYRGKLYRSDFDTL